PLAPLQYWHAATRLNQVSPPSRHRGRTWSTVSAYPPQYAHIYRSRRSTPSRVTRLTALYGMCTYSRNATDTGSSITNDGLWMWTAGLWTSMTYTAPRRISRTASCHGNPGQHAVVGVVDLDGQVKHQDRHGRVPPF